MLDNDIASPSPEIACHLTRWKRNRDAVAGQDAIRAAKTAYLPRVYEGQDDREYSTYQSRVVFYPATQRTLENHVGLVFRKDPSIVADDSVADILSTITARYGLEDLARELLAETLITNFTGLLVDTPPSKAGLSAATAIQAGQRPFLSVYRGESVLEVQQGIINNRFALVRVRLLDDENTVRELVIADGVYQVIMHRKSEGAQWIADAPITPTKGGATLSEIPFEIVSTKAGCIEPPKAPLDDLVILNLSHYLASADLSNVLRCIGHPIRFVTGYSAKDDGGNVVQPQFVVRADQVWVLDDPQAKVGISEHSGAGVDALRDQCQDIAAQMAQVGARALATEKAAAEAAETHAIRRASENSSLAALANRVSAHIERQVNRALGWINLPTISYRLNTDYLPVPMSAQDITALLSVVQAGRMSAETFFATLKQGEIVPDSLSYEDERDRIEQDVADRPPTDSGAF